MNNQDSTRQVPDFAEIAELDPIRIEIRQAYSLSQGAMLVATISRCEHTPTGREKWVPAVRNMALAESVTTAEYLTTLGVMLTEASA